MLSSFAYNEIETTAPKNKKKHTKSLYSALVSRNVVFLHGYRILLGNKNPLVRCLG